MNVTADVLGDGYEALGLFLGSDFEGEVTATLVRRAIANSSPRAVLYLHGFSDYFFQTHMADFYVGHGYDFYALDLRKNGRSLRPHQTPNLVGDLTEYFAEIEEAVRLVREVDGHRVLLLSGHGTGGLTAALWADRFRGKGLIDGLFLNSPALDLPLRAVPRWAYVAAANLLRRSAPAARLPLAQSDRYVRSIHRGGTGEWDFDLAWKPLTGFPTRAAWLAAVRRAQKRVHEGLSIEVPVLVMASARSVDPSDEDADATAGDAVLNVDHIARWAPRLGRDVALVRVDGGVHDLVLSSENPRDLVFTELGDWIRERLPPS